jgi:hypothetical protein
MKKKMKKIYFKGCEWVKLKEKQCVNLRADGWWWWKTNTSVAVGTDENN